MSTMEENLKMKMIIKKPKKTSYKIEKSIDGRDMLICFDGESSSIYVVGELYKEISRNTYEKMRINGFDMEDITVVIWVEEF